MATLCKGTDAQKQQFTVYRHRIFHRVLEDISLNNPPPMKHNIARLNLMFWSTVFVN